MLPEERDAAYLWDMAESAKEISDMMSGVNLSQYLENGVLLRATERSIEIIGEAAGRISETFKETHPQIPWGVRLSDSATSSCMSMGRLTTKCSTRPR